MSFRGAPYHAYLSQRANDKDTPYPKDHLHFGTAGTYAILAMASDIRLGTARTKIAFLFKELAVLDTRSMVDRYVKPVVHHREAPAAVRDALTIG